LRLSSFSKTEQRSLGATCGLLLLAAGAVLGGPLDELRSHAQLSPVDLATLKRGQIIVEKGTAGSFPRGIHLESCYFIHAPINVVGDKLLHWNPVPHKELEVRSYHEFPLPPAADAFQALRLNRAVPDDDWLLQQTAKITQGAAPNSLHLTNEEADLLRQKGGDPSLAWQEILRRRATSLARGGMAAVGPYTAGSSISPASELRGLLTLAPKAARHFQPVTRSHPIFAAGKPASEAVGYWETTKVRDHTTLQLGIFAAQKTPESWLLIDCVYYPTDTYFMALDLFQLWSVEGGTLVWQVGSVSAPFRSYLGGIDRYVAGKQMMQGTIDTIKAFRSDVEK
jgi:hypothetical protein